MVGTAMAAFGGALLGLLIAVRLGDGSYASLVQGWYRPVLIATSAVLLVMASLVATQLIRTRARWQAKPSWQGIAMATLTAVPLILGFTYRPSPLGSASLDSPQDGGANSVQFSASASSPDAANRNIYQWAYEFVTAPPGSLIGNSVDVVGFVYHGEAAPQDEFEVARFVVACCVADAMGYAVPVLWAESAGLPQDRWVRVRGRVGVSPGGDLIILAEAVEPVAAPSNPYIYP